MSKYEPTTCRFPRRPRAHSANGTLIGSAVFAQHAFVTTRHTERHGHRHIDRQTDRLQATLHSGNNRRHAMRTNNKAFDDSSLGSVSTRTRRRLGNY